MGAIVITGYSGTRHISPALDAAVYRSVVGSKEYVLAEGNMAKGSMPSINQFTVLDGLVSIQGRMVKVLQETLPVDTCANGYRRIDLVVLRFTHSNSTNIDAAQLMVLKGTEVQSGNNPVEPSYNTGDLDQGATVVDMPLYRITLDGSTVTFERIHERGFTMEQLRPLRVSLSSVSSLPVIAEDERILEDHVMAGSMLELSNAAAWTDDWAYTTHDGSVTLSGPISGTTDIVMWLQIPWL